MAGLINIQQQQPIRQSQQAQPNIAPEQNIEAEKQKMFKVQKIVLAAQKVIYGEQTRAEFLKMMRGEDVVTMAADITTTVMLMLIGESRMKINPELIIPAGVVVVGDVLDFIEKATGKLHSEAQVEDAIEAFIKKMMQSVGGNMEQQGVMQ